MKPVHQTKPSTNRISAIVAGIFIVVLTLIFFWKLIFTNLILVGVDSFLYFYPYRAFVTRSLLEGHVPLWNPHLFMGTPLLANMQTAVLYPLHWPLLWLSEPKQVAVSIVIHVAGAGLGMLVFCRRSLRLNWLGAVTAGVIFGLGGFLAGQVEHINQLNGVAWLPWAFLLLDSSVDRGVKGAARWRFGAALGLSLVIALMLLAGHAQAVFISMVGLALYALLGPARHGLAGETPVGDVGKEPEARSIPDGAPRRLRLVTAQAWSFLKSRLPYLLVFAGAVLAALLLAAVQLVPTMELSRLSVRSGGLTYREVTSFSLNPWLLRYTLLPPYGVDLSQVFGEAYSEYVAYVGVSGLLLAMLAAWCTRSRPATRFFVLLAGVGLFLAMGRVNPFYYILYKLVPGFDLFRVPARWMLLYTFGMAVLAAIGIDYLSRAGWRIPGLNIPSPGFRRGLALILAGVLCLELLVASRGLRFNQPTAPEAFTFLRPSIAHLETDPGIHRFLSLSGIVYDPGDLGEMQAMLAGQLPDKAIYDYVVAAKEKEVLFYNLPLLYGLYSVDGYDGGLLPLRDFVTMERLFLDEDDLSVDGRLREKLRLVPPSRLLSLLGVKYVITDKVFDVWIDDVFYDLQFTTRLNDQSRTYEVPLEEVDFPTTSVGVVSHLIDAADLPDGAPVATITLVDESGWSLDYDLLAGRDTGQGQYVGDEAHGLARVGHTWDAASSPYGSFSSGNDYIVVIPLDRPRRLTNISIRPTISSGELAMRGISLIDSRTKTSRQVTLSPDSGDGYGAYRLVHSGDVKIYQNQKVLPRVFVVSQAEVIEDYEQILTRLRDPAFDPARTAIVSGGKTLSGQGGGETQILEYTPEYVSVAVTSDEPGYLVLTDTFYPGWIASVDGNPAPIHRADLMFRAVEIGAGNHQVEFSYRPASVRTGQRISGAALLLWMAGLVWMIQRRKKGGVAPIHQTVSLSGQRNG